MKQRFGKIFSWFFIVFSTTPGSFGIYLGRFLRWDSWNIFTRPVKLLHHITQKFSHPETHILALKVTLLFSVFLLITYLSIRQIINTYTSRNNYL
jgi:uncharacterized membrane protein